MRALYSYIKFQGSGISKGVAAATLATPRVRPWVFLDQGGQIASLRAQNKADAANMARANWV